jgi:hypothetical protein
VKRVDTSGKSTGFREAESRMMGTLCYEVMSNGRRVALCVDPEDAQCVARLYRDGQISERHLILTDNPQPIEPGVTYKLTLEPVAGELRSGE